MPLENFAVPSMHASSEDTCAPQVPSSQIAIPVDKLIDTAVEKNNKQNGKTRMVFVGVAVAAFVILSLNATATIMSLEAAKESHVTGATMVNLEGEPVRVSSSEIGVVDGRLCARNAKGECSETTIKTAQHQMFATLFDLPLFDSVTLSSLQKVVVPFVNGDEVVVAVTGVRKNPSAQACTLFIASGGHIAIDAKNNVATIRIGAEEHTVQNNNPRRIQDTESQPRLYHGPEMIASDEHGRRLNSASDAWADGWVANGETLFHALGGRAIFGDARKL